MATQVFVLNNTADLQISADYAADEAVTNLAAGDKTVSFIANGKRSVDIDSSEVIRVTAYEYDAGTAQVSTINLTAVAAGTTEYVKIINTTLGTMNLPMKTFEGADAAAIVALMTAEFAKSDSEFAGFSASASSEVITVTAPINSSFRLAGAEGVVIAYTGGSTAVMEPSTGEATDVTELYDLYAGYDGITNRVGFPVKRPTSPIVAGTNYDICVLEAVTKASSKDGMSAQKGELVKVIFAVNQTKTLAVGTATTGIDILLNAWIA